MQETAIEIENVLSRVRRPATYTGWDQRRGIFYVRFELCGTYEFSSRSGAGKGRSEAWKIPLEWIRALRGDPDYRPLPAGKRKRKVRAVKEDQRQMDWTK